MEEGTLMHGLTTITHGGVGGWGYKMAWDLLIIHGVGVFFLLWVLTYAQIKWQT